MSGYKRRGRLAVAFAVGAALCWTQVAQAQQDSRNPSCPLNPNWSSYPEMQFTFEEVNGQLVLLAEGRITESTPDRLRAALDEREPVEIWIRSPGGHARAGNAAGRLIRERGYNTRIPAGWACFSACNFMFMGGEMRAVDEGGLFIVHMFTHTGDREAIRSEVSQGVDNTIGLIGEIEQQSALLATEDNDFLIRMGVSRQLLTDVMYRTPAVAARDGDRSTRRCLTRDEVLRYNVATPLFRS